MKTRTQNKYYKLLCLLHSLRSRFIKWQQLVKTKQICCLNHLHSPQCSLAWTGWLSHIDIRSGIWMSATYWNIHQKNCFNRKCLWPTFNSFWNIYLQSIPDFIDIISTGPLSSSIHATVSIFYFWMKTTIFRKWIFLPNEEQSWPLWQFLSCSVWTSPVFYQKSVIGFPPSRKLPSAPLFFHFTNISPKHLDFTKLPVSMLTQFYINVPLMLNAA